LLWIKCVLVQRSAHRNGVSQKVARKETEKSGCSGTARMSAQRHQVRAEIAHVFTDQEMRIAFDYPHLELRRQRSETLQGGSKLGHDRVDMALYESIADSPGGQFGQDWGLVSMHRKAFCLIRHTQGDTQRSTGGR
jgi:hypothetical protein